MRKSNKNFLKYSQLSAVFVVFLVSCKLDNQGHNNRHSNEAHQSDYDLTFGKRTKANSNPNINNSNTTSSVEKINKISSNINSGSSKMPDYTVLLEGANGSNKSYLANFSYIQTNPSDIKTLNAQIEGYPGSTGTLIAFSDLHLGKPGADQKLEAFKQFVSDYAKNSSKSITIYFGGDFFDASSHAEFKSKALEQLSSGANVPSEKDVLLLAAKLHGEAVAQHMIQLSKDAMIPTDRIVFVAGNHDYMRSFRKNSDGSWTNIITGETSSDQPAYPVDPAVAIAFRSPLKKAGLMFGPEKYTESSDVTLPGESTKTTIGHYPPKNGANVSARLNAKVDGVPVDPNAEQKLPKGITSVTAPRLFGGDFHNWFSIIGFGWDIPGLMNFVSLPTLGASSYDSFGNGFVIAPLGVPQAPIKIIGVSELGGNIHEPYAPPINDYILNLDRKPPTNTPQ